MSKKPKAVEPIKGHDYVVTGDHPHAGIVAKFMGVKRAPMLDVDGYLFKNTNTGETFFIFSGGNLSQPAIKVNEKSV